MSGPQSAALAGVRVLDLSRMLPGAVLARRLLDWGAEVIKVEAPEGDALRHCPPHNPQGVGAAFANFYQGAQFRSADWREAEGRALLRAWALEADVLVESFRPGTMASWGLDGPSLRAQAPGLITVSLPAYQEAHRVGHDLDVAAAVGLLGALGGQVPQVQVVDASAGLLAAGDVAAALLLRAQRGEGSDCVRSLASGAEALMGWKLADEEAGGFSFRAQALTGQAPAYGLYELKGGQKLAVACVEPKFWAEFLKRIGVGPAHLGLGLATGAEAAPTWLAVSQALLAHSWGEWESRGLAEGLPLSLVR